MLGPYQRVKLTQQVLAESFDISQATACRIISAYTSLIADAPGHSVPAVEDIDPTATLIIDGTVLACWDWKDTPGRFSGKYRKTGLNVQVACTPPGRSPGSRTRCPGRYMMLPRCGPRDCWTSRPRTYPAGMPRQRISGTRATPGWA